MKILDIGGGFNGCETQLELVSTSISVQSSEKWITLNLITFFEALILQTFKTVIILFRLSYNSDSLHGIRTGPVKFYEFYRSITQSCPWWTFTSLLPLGFASLLSLAASLCPLLSLLLWMSSPKRWWGATAWTRHTVNCPPLHSTIKEKHCISVQIQLILTCFGSTSRWTTSQRWASISVLHERRGLWIFRQQTLWSPDLCPICSQGESP